MHGLCLTENGASLHAFCTLMSLSFILLFLFVLSLCFSSLTYFNLFYHLVYTWEVYFKSSLEVDVIMNEQQQQNNLIKS